MIRYEKASPDQMDLALDFGNFVFSQAHRPHDFRTLVPKVYGEGQTLPNDHYLALEGDRIRAMVGCLPITMNVAGMDLRFALIGTVSVHPYARGGGHMKALMAMAAEDQIAGGADLFLLGGQRQRYQYFGYEQTGTRLRYEISAPSVRHALAAVDTAGWDFAPMDAHDQASLDAAFGLYEASPLHGARPRSFFHSILQTWDCTPWAILREGKMAGYLTCSAPGEINELMLQDESALPAIIKAWMGRHGLRQMYLEAAPFEEERCHRLETFAEDFSIVRDSMIRVQNWQRVLQAYLRLKAGYHPMADGRAVVEIEGTGCLEIQVQGGVATVEKTHEKAALRLSSMEAVDAFFSPLYGVLPGKPELLDWAPLPFFFPRQDGF